VSGIGAAKLERYGEALLALLRGEREGREAREGAASGNSSP